MAELKCIDMLYEHVSKFLPISREKYVQTLAGWDINSIELGEEFAGVLMMRGHEIHVCLDQYVALRRARKLIRSILISKLNELGYLVTMALKSDERAINFIERLGFVKTKEDETFVFYRIENTKFH